MFYKHPLFKGYVGVGVLYCIYGNVYYMNKYIKDKTFPENIFKDKIIGTVFGGCFWPFALTGICLDKAREKYQN